MCVTAIIGAAAIGGAASIAAGAMGASAAEKAAAAQESSDDKALALQKETTEQARKDSLPWMEAGRAGLNQYMAELGIETPDNAEQLAAGSKFKETPGYQFQVQEGEKAVVNNMAALGMKNSGAAVKALTGFRQGLADQTFGNYLNQLSGTAGMGQNQVNTTNALSIGSANNQANTIQDAGAARASGYVGAANSWMNALKGVSNSANNALGWSWATGGLQSGATGAPAMTRGFY